ncbi:MAG: M28 family peptidase [Pirellulaceae bacterium]|jgi:hypothetical protein|nr:M28 family peptidase [Pirellulaceae bacterium]MDP7019664.1 M28 family peptidase [Pirellulaceae bacterium]
MNSTILLAALAVIGADPVDAADVEGRLRRDAQFFSADERQGRGVGTRGLEQAAVYIADQFDGAGLRTKLINDRPYFVFSTTSKRVPDKSSSIAFVNGRGDRIELRIGESFAPLSLSGTADVDFPLAFVGYGITDKKSDYDDYQSVDVQGCAVVVLRREPRQTDPDSPFNGDKNSEHAYLSRKAANAFDHGAKMVIFCTDEHSLKPASADKPADQLLAFKVTGRAARRQAAIVHCVRGPLDRVFAAAEVASLSQREREIDGDLKPRSMRLPDWRVSGRVVIRREGNNLKNVLGMIGPADAVETVVVGAHYDHLGRGGLGSLAPWTSAIHNGADDNASGTAVLLEVARRVVSRRSELKRRVLFIAFSAEEQGLIGSERYCRAPLIPMADTVAMLNLDMVGRLRDDKLTVYGTGTALQFDDFVDRWTNKHSLKVFKRTGGAGPSDHASFFRRGVPVLHFFTGFHTDYHRPGDDFEKLNIKGMSRIADMTTEMVLELATAADKPTPSKPASKPTSKPGASRGEPPHVVMNINVKAVAGGLEVTAVAAGGPGEKAGLRVGDLILRVNEIETKLIADVRRAVKEKSPGDVVAVDIQRGESKLGVNVTLVSPAGPEKR